MPLAADKCRRMKNGEGDGAARRFFWRWDERPAYLGERMSRWALVATWAAAAGLAAGAACRGPGSEIEIVRVPESAYLPPEAGTDAGAALDARPPADARVRAPSRWLTGCVRAPESVEDDADDLFSDCPRHASPERELDRERTRQARRRSRAQWCCYPPEPPPEAPAE